MPSSETLFHRLTNIPALDRDDGPLLKPYLENGTISLKDYDSALVFCPAFSYVMSVNKFAVPFFAFAPLPLFTSARVSANWFRILASTSWASAALCVWAPFTIKRGFLRSLENPDGIIQAFEGIRRNEIPSSESSLGIAPTPMPSPRMRTSPPPPSKSRWDEIRGTKASSKPSIWEAIRQNRGEEREPVSDAAQQSNDDERTIRAQEQARFDALLEAERKTNHKD